MIKTSICPGFLKNPEVMSIEDIRAYESNTIWNGIPLLLLMENAGRSIADAIECKLGNLESRKVVIFAGKGGNGGDALVAGRHLAARGANVTAYLLYDIRFVDHKDALLNLKALQNSKHLKIVHLEDPREYEPVEADVLIDGILGIGVKGKLREPIASALRAFNSSKGYRVAVDVPTGVDPETGNVAEGSAIVDLTVTMHALKPGLLSEKVKHYVGELLVAEIGMIKDSQIFAGPGDVVIRIPKRPKDAIKGGNGKVLTIGGSYHYFGAPFYAASSALIAGADLSFLASPEKVAYSASQNNPGIIPVPLEGDYLNKNHVSMLLEEAKRVDVVSIGPGLGNREETKEAVIEIINSLRNKPIVIDADALKALAEKELKLWKDVVLTLHKGDAALLAKNEGSQEELAKIISSNYSSTVIVKAPIDVICSPEGMCRYNKTGHPAMTVAGTCVVLTGIIAGFMARKISIEKKMNPIHIVSAAAYILGRSGELAVKEKGDNITALDVMQKIPQAMLESEGYIGGGG
ncbi:MAG: NAD(P)H-hydrate dehydratase [Caldisphaera sp.]